MIISHEHVGCQSKLIWCKENLPNLIGISIKNSGSQPSERKLFKKSGADIKNTTVFLYLSKFFLHQINF